MSSNFKDHFSEGSTEYGVYRPGYPKELFTYLSAISQSNERAWDCATGNGQSALEVSEHFDEVIATDASKNQIDNAVKEKGIVYRVEKAEKTSIDSESVDLITVAQALHWFNIKEFTNEALRVLKTKGVLAVWAYGLLDINTEINRVVNHLYSTTLDSYWPPERKIVEEEYKNVKLPIQEMEPPTFQMKLDWELSQLIGYLCTWSSVKNYDAIEGVNPVGSLYEEISDLWGDPKRKISINWPLILKAWVKNT